MPEIVKFSQSPSTIFWLIAIGFILGIGTSSAVYWLIVSPRTSEAVAPVLADRSDPGPQELNATNEVSDTDDPSLETVRNLGDLDEIKSSFKRGLALRSLLAESDEAQVAEMLRETQNLVPNGDTLDAQAAIVQRLATINPQLALSQVLEMQRYPFWPGGLAMNIFREWAHSNLDEAVAHARTLENDWKVAAVQGIVQARTDLSEEVLRSIARELDNEQIAVVAVTEQKIEEAMGDPEKAWNELVSTMQDDSQYRWSIARVASAWVEKSGLSVLDQIASSLTNLETRRTVVRGVLTDSARVDPAAAFRFALTLEHDRYNLIVSGVASVWAQSDPHLALTAASNIEEKSLRNTLENTIVTTWAYAKPREVLDAITGLPEHVQPSAMSAALSKIVQDSPEEAIPLVAAIEDGEAKKQAASSVASTWSYRDHKAALDWILNDPSVEEIRTQLIQEILFVLVQANPQLALETALSQPIPEETNGVGMEYNVLTTLAYSNLEMALELLPQVRKGRTRIRTIQSVSQMLIRNGDTNKALDLVFQVDEADRPDVYSAVASTWARSDPDGLLNSMNLLPSREIISKAAMVLVSRNIHQKTLTEEQIEEAKKFLTEEDAEALAEEEADVRLVR